MGQPCSHALYQLGPTQEACDPFLAGLYRFRDEHPVWPDLACFSCALGNMKQARELLDKAIELGDKEVKPRALEDAGLEQLWKC